MQNGPFEDDVPIENGDVNILVMFVYQRFYGFTSTLPYGDTYSFDARSDNWSKGFSHGICRTKTQIWYLHINICLIWVDF